MNPVYIGLDTATTTGVAFWFPVEQVAKVFQVKGTPVEQLRFILTQAPTPAHEMTFVLEKLHVFRNGVTTRSLLERYGYVKYSLLAAGFRVQEVSPKVARHNLGLLSKGETFDHFSQFFEGEHLTNDETDALAVAVYQGNMDEYVVWEDRLVVRELKRGEHEQAE